MKRKRIVQYFFSCRLFPSFLNTGTTDETLQQSGKQVFYQTHIEEFELLN